MSKTLFPVLLASTAVLIGCNETHYNDNLIPVDKEVRGFWTMISDTDCELAEHCYLDYSNHNNKLYAIDEGDRMLTLNEVSKAETATSGRLGDAIYLAAFEDDNGVQTPQPRLQTDTFSDFESRPISDIFTIHVRATGEQGSILSLWNENGLALHLEVLDGVLLATFDKHQKKLFTSIDSEVFQEIQIVSNGETVSLINHCEQVGEFTRTSGSPILSDSPLKLTAYEMKGGYTDATQFTGAIDVIRISDRAESNIFCNQ
ncbi:hypothetical protein [Vibrio sp. 10N.261.51.F12]|uniref:hypothetical protein n=1 Tax=Vibrio sp. 10N.261.51.F12 TaxID=3229679 RepID=UPI00354BF0FA